MGRVAGTEETATFSRAINLLRRKQDNGIGVHTSYTSLMVPGTAAMIRRGTDKEARIKKFADVEELKQLELLGGYGSVAFRRLG